jgi:hypothetical protein
LEKKEVTDPGFEPWSSAFEQAHPTIALLEVSSKTCTQLFTAGSEGIVRGMRTGKLGSFHSFV